MPILIVSDNPFFNEVIHEIVSRGETEAIELNHEDALVRICALRPDVIILDKSIATPHFENLLAEARDLEKTRTIVLDPVLNEFILMDSRRAILGKVEDLMEAISDTDQGRTLVLPQD